MRLRAALFLTGEAFLSQKYCSAAGHVAAKKELAQLKSKICSEFEPDSGSNSLTDSEREERCGTEVSQAPRYIQMAALETLIMDYRPVIQKQTEKVFVGNSVSVRYDGGGFTFVLGGPGEPKIYSKQGIKILNYLAEFGASFLGREVGDVVNVTYEGRQINAYITAIGLPPEVDGEESVTTVSRLSIDATGQRVSAAT